MKSRFPSSRAVVFSVAIATCISAGAAAFRLVSAGDPSQHSPAGGGGDSFAPILSLDGRFVLFASTANNLVLNASNVAIPLLIPPRLNVFLRDRASNTTSLVSVNLTGTGGGNGDSMPAAISTNGHYALFESTARDLATNDTNVFSDVFVRDLLAGTTLLVSTSTNGGAGNGESRSSVMTPDGRYVAFVSSANNLVPGDTNGIADVFVRDMQSGLTTLASIGATPTNSNLGSSESPEITPDGRYVTFYSTATNLVAGVQSVGEVYVRDMIGGTTIWASTNARPIVGGLLGNSNIVCFNQAISADGKFVAFEANTNPPTASVARGILLRFSLETGLTDIVHTNANVPRAAYESARSLDLSPDGRFIAFVGNTNGVSGNNTCVYLWDAQSSTTLLISGDLSNGVPTNSACEWPVVEAGGRFVAFLSTATNLVTNSLAGDYHLYVRDVLAATTTVVNAGSDGTAYAVNASSIPWMSANALLVTFEGLDGGLVEDDRNRDYDVFLRDLAAKTNELISVHHPALPTASANGPSGLSDLSVSADGRYVAFSSDAGNLVSDDSNQLRDIFLRDLVTGTNLLVSVATNGAASDGQSSEPAISANGRYVAFTSAADNLAAGDTNKSQDVFVRELQTGTTVLASINTNGVGPGNGASYSPILAADGRYLLFRSQAKNLAAGSFSSSSENLFFRDLQTSTTFALTTNGVLAAAITPDGRLVAFNAANNLYLWDSQTATRVYTNSGTSVLDRISISPDTQRIVILGNTSLRAIDRQINSTWTIMSSVFAAPRAGLRFSADGRFLAYEGSAGYTNAQVFLYDFVTRTNLLVSQSASSAPGNSSSDSPSLTPDGRFVIYRSFATNIVPITNTTPNLFLHDRASGKTVLLTESRFGGGPSDNRSLKPVISADGRVFFFQSWASDLVGHDFNHNSDIFSFALLYCSIVPGMLPGQGPTLSWPARPGETYGVQFKDNLSDSTWQEVSGNITFQDDKAQITDLAPASGQRFYRVVAL